MIYRSTIDEGAGNETSVSAPRSHCAGMTTPSPCATAFPVVFGDHCDGSESGLSRKESGARWSLRSNLDIWRSRRVLPEDPDGVGETDNANNTGEGGDGDEKEDARGPDCKHRAKGGGSNNNVGKGVWAAIKSLGVSFCERFMA